jgi:predicted RNA polymerase sigma factor
VSGPTAAWCRSPSRTAACGTPSRSPRASRSCRRRSPATGWASSRHRPPSAALHADAPTAEDTDWVQIVEWYDELVRLTDSPIVRLNRAVAVGQADGPRAGLAALQDTLPRHTAVAAYLHERAGDLTTAAQLYAEAAQKAPTLAERHHLTRQAARLNTHRSR